MAANDAIGSGVKALEWEHHPQATGQVRAPSPWGTYRIIFFGDYALWGCKADGVSLGNKAASIDEAKAAAQADFERRVLSCLSTHTAAGAGPVGEAVAWRWRYYGEGVERPWTVRQTPVAPSAPTPGMLGIEVEPLYAHPVEEPGDVERACDEAGCKDHIEALLQRALDAEAALAALTGDAQEAGTYVADAARYPG